MKRGVRYGFRFFLYLSHFGLHFVDFLKIDVRHTAGHAASVLEKSTGSAGAWTLLNREKLEIKISGSGPFGRTRNKQPPWVCSVCIVVTRSRFWPLQGVTARRPESKKARLHSDGVLNSFTAFFRCCERMEHKDVTCVMASGQLLACTSTFFFSPCFMMAGSLCTVWPLLIWLISESVSQSVCRSLCTRYEYFFAQNKKYTNSYLGTRDTLDTVFVSTLFP